VSSEIITDITAGRARVTVNRPRARNALTPEMMDRMLGFCLEVATRSDVGVLLLDAAGENFICGGDLKAFAARAAQPPDGRAATFEQLVHRMNPLLTTLERMPQLVVASARGHVAGSGVSLIGAADLAIVSETAKFSLSHVKLAACADAGATYFLPRQVGMKRAMEIVCLGDMFDAWRALSFGLVNKVTRDADLESETLALVERLSSGPYRAVAEGKQLVRQSLGNSLAEQLNQEALAVGRVTQTADFVEGVSAFEEKRSPRFH
jgi:2-(1,2-epoxy-1,2-dihydrophenyl)acetyl-CoA isomerase